MQKLINVIALLSGLVSLSVVGGGVYLYKNAGVLMEDARAKATEEVKKAVMSAVPDIVEGLMPELPKVTGPAMPTKTGPAIPF